MQTQTEHLEHRGLSLTSLRIVRERRGLTQEELAVQAGMTRATIVNLEQGASHARPSSAQKLATALGVSIDVLAGAAPLPVEEDKLGGVLSDYFKAAMRHAIYRVVGGGQERIYAAIPGLPGLWARGMTREEAEHDLREALEWWVLTAVFEHRPLPAFDGASLEIVEESKDGSTILYPEAEPSNESFLEGVNTSSEPTGI